MRTSVARVLRVGLEANLLLISVLSIFDSVDCDEVAFQQEQYAEVSDAQPILLRPRGQLFDVAGQIILKNIEAVTDIAPRFRRERS
jgi:hypothetical protein